MDNIIHPFQIPIYQSFIEKDSFTQIKKEVKDFIKDKKYLLEKSWDSNTLSSYYFDDKDDFSSHSASSQIQFHVKEYLKSWKYKDNVSLQLKLKNIWVNIAEPNSFQEIHHHGNAFISGVMYVDVNENSGGIKFYNLLSSASILMDEPLNFPTEYGFSPYNSQIVLFPAWLPHRVSINKSNQNRISVSFNIDVNFKK